MLLREYPPGEFNPRGLSNEERENPYLFIHALFDYAHLPQLREMLWEWLRATVTGSFQHGSRTDRENILDFFEKLQKLIEAAHLIHLKTKDS
jgi:hypothetical protein